MRQGLIRLLALLLVVVPLLGAWANETSAASSRVAVIKELKGTVKVKKAGGSKEFTAFAKMSLNEGDVLSVGSSGSAVLQFANGTSEDDKMTVGANTKLSFSKLSNKKGTTTKVSMWSGSAWVDVKSIASKDDQFTLETPTAVMGVRGTHFMTFVNPVTGSTQLSVAAGIVSMAQQGPNGTVPPAPQPIYPSQSILTLPSRQGLPAVVPAPIDPADLVNQAGPALIEAMLRASIQIQQENDRLMSQYLKDLAIPSSDLDRNQNNIDHLVSVIVNEAMKAKIIQQNTIDRIQEELLKNAGQKIDLTIKELLLSAEERLKQAAQREAERIAKETAERIAREEAEKRNQELLEKLKQKQEEQKKAAEEAIKKKQDKAYNDYESQLDEAGKKRLQEERAKLTGQAPSSSPSNSGGGGGGGGGSSSGSPGGSPSNGNYVNPLQSLKVSYYEYQQTEGYSSIPPTKVDFDVPLTGNSYEYKIPSTVNSIELAFATAAAFADYDLKMSIDGVPEYYADTVMELYLRRARTEITIEVKPRGQIATSANTKRFTLFVTKPSLPEGYAFTTTTDGESLIWEPLGDGQFKAVAKAEAISEITFNVTYNGSAVEDATLYCNSENCNEVERTGLTARNLAEGETYYFGIDMGNTILNFELYNIDEPDWQQFFDGIEFREDYNDGPSVPFSSQGEEKYAEVSYFAKELYMEYSGETEDGYYMALRGIWDERDWTYVPGDWTYACESEDMEDCDRLQQGDNRFILYVSLGGDIYNHSYVLNIHQNDPFELFDYPIGQHSGLLEQWYAGDNTWAIYAPTLENEIALVMFDNLRISGSSGDGQVQLVEFEEEQNSVVKATYMSAPGEYVLNVHVTNIAEPDKTYSPYKLVIYNDLNLDLDEYKVAGVNYSEGSLYAHSPFVDVTINSTSVVGQNKEIVGVYDRLGNAVPMSPNESYFLDSSLLGYYYVVVRDTTTNYRVTTVIDQQYYL